MIPSRNRSLEEMLSLRILAARVLLEVQEVLPEFLLCPAVNCHELVRHPHISDNIYCSKAWKCLRCLNSYHLLDCYKVDKDTYQGLCRTCSTEMGLGSGALQCDPKLLNVLQIIYVTHKKEVGAVGYLKSIDQNRYCFDCRIFQMPERHFCEFPGRRLLCINVIIENESVEAHWCYDPHNPNGEGNGEEIKYNVNGRDVHYRRTNWESIVSLLTEVPQDRLTNTGCYYCHEFIPVFYDEDCQKCSHTPKRFTNITPEKWYESLPNSLEYRDLHAESFDPAYEE